MRTAKAKTLQVEEAPSLPPPVREHLASMLRTAFGDPLALLPSDSVDASLSRLDAVLSRMGETLGDEMRAGLSAAAPALRAYALSLSRNESRADDLVQETMLKAWKNHARFEPGTNLQAWLSTILRNLFISELRKTKREVEDVDGTIAGTLSVEPSQGDRLEVRDLQAAMGRLTPEQRDAIILVTVKDVPYHKAAAMLGCPVGTLKTRVCRARDRLAEMLGHEGRTAVMVRSPRQTLAAAH